MNDTLFSVKNQVALVSGASRGIGKAIAEAFARRGAKVVITGRNPDSLKEAADSMSSIEGEVVPLVCDAARTDQIVKTVEAVMNRFKRIDVLINVAGVNRRKPSLEVTEEDYDFIMDINLKGAFFFSQQAGRHMIAAGKGSQINVASLNTDRPLKNVLPYAASKAAMGHMTRALAMEWGPHGVRVNALAPGFVLTDLTRKLWSHPDMQAWGPANTPLRRLGVPEDMAGAAVFLASKASAFMTGQILYVDGGFTSGWSWPIPPDAS